MHNMVEGLLLPYLPRDYLTMGVVVSQHNNLDTGVACPTHYAFFNYYARSNRLNWDYPNLTYGRTWITGVPDGYEYDGYITDPSQGMLLHANTANDDNWNTADSIWLWSILGAFLLSQLPPSTLHSYCRKQHYSCTLTFYFSLL